MAKTLRNSQIKRDRRTILAALNLCYPGSMPLAELFDVVLDCNPSYERGLLVKDAIYLCQKGYLMISRNDGTEQRGVSVDACKAVLTASGTDVANQLVDDPTLDV